MENKKLYISLLIDNSLTIDEDNLNNFKSAFEIFMDHILKVDLKKQIKVELISYNDFEPLVIKKFDDETYDLNNLAYGKIPFFDRMICKGLEDINEEVSKQIIKEKPYRPWLVSLIDSKTFDEEFKCKNMLSKMLSNKTITYFPFKLKHNISPKFKSMQEIKNFIEIKDYNFNGFFNWLYEMAIERINTPDEKKIQLNKDSFIGWTTLS